VRAYPEGEASGDQGYVLSVEGRLALPQLAPYVPGQVQLVGFVDTGSVTLDKNPWTISTNRKTLSGAGFGLNWTVDNAYAVKGYVARKLGDEKATSAPDSENRFWLELLKSF
jgi:hemolysin activation/secretion protein